MNPPVLNCFDGVGDLDQLARGDLGFGQGVGFDESIHVATISSLSAPRRTILSASSGNGRCSALASSHGARIHTSRSSSVVRITGMALGWIGSTTALGDVVRNT